MLAFPHPSAVLQGLLFNFSKMSIAGIAEDNPFSCLHWIVGARARCHLVSDEGNTVTVDSCVTGPIETRKVVACSHKIDVQSDPKRRP